MPTNTELIEQIMATYNKTLSLSEITIKLKMPE